MKTLIPIIICSCVVVVALVVAGIFILQCNNHSNNPLTINDGSGNVIYYGMDRGSVERILGEFEGSRVLHYITIGDAQMLRNFRELLVLASNSVDNKVCAHCTSTIILKSP